MPFPCRDGSGGAVTAGVLPIALSTVPLPLPQNSLIEGTADALAGFPAHAPQHGQPVGLHRDCLVIGLLRHLHIQAEEGWSGFAHGGSSEVHLLLPTEILTASFPGSSRVTFDFPSPSLTLLLHFSLSTDIYKAPILCQVLF